MKNIYCKHVWFIGDCGTDYDCWRECQRCGTMWRPYKTVEKQGRWWWIFGVDYQNFYGKEPKNVVGTVVTTSD